MDKQRRPIGPIPMGATPFGSNSTPLTTTTPVSWASRIRKSGEESSTSVSRDVSSPFPVMNSPSTKRSKASQDPPEYPNLSWSAAHVTSQTQPKKALTAPIMASYPTRPHGPSKTSSLKSHNPKKSSNTLHERNIHRDQVSPYPAGTPQVQQGQHQHAPKLTNTKWGMKSTKPTVANTSTAGRTEGKKKSKKSPDKAAKPIKGTPEKTIEFSQSSFPTLSSSSNAGVAVGRGPGASSKSLWKPAPISKLAKSKVSHSQNTTGQTKSKETHPSSKPKEKSNKKGTKAKPSTNLRTLGAFVPTANKSTSAKEKNSKKGKAFNPPNKKMTVLPKPSTKLPQSIKAKPNLLEKKIMSPAPRTNEEHDNTLFFAKATITQPGKQRVRPRKKHLSTLKKNILKERLRQWKTLQEEKEEERKDGLLESPLVDTPGDIDLISKNVEDGTAEVVVEKRTIVSIEGYASFDEMEDDDEYDEIVSNLRDMATKIGPIETVDIPRISDNEKDCSCTAYVRFMSEIDAKKAKEAWDGRVVAGSSLIVSLSPDHQHTALQSSQEENGSDNLLRHGQETIKGRSLVIHGFCSLDELEDDDEYDEILSNLRDMAGEVGPVESVSLPRTAGEVNDDDTCIAYVKFFNGSDATKAKERWNNKVISGSSLKVESLPDEQQPSSQESNGASEGFQHLSQNTTDSLDYTALAIDGYASFDDLEDDDEYEEIVCNLQHMAEEVGPVESVSIPRDGKERSSCTAYVRFISSMDAKAAKKSWDSTVISGITLKVKFVTDIYRTVSTPAPVQEQEGSALSTIVIDGYVNADDLEDDDEYEEILSNLRDMAEEIGPIDTVNIPRDDESCKVYVTFQHQGDGIKAVDCWNGIYIGGTCIQVRTISSRNEDMTMPIDKSMESRNDQIVSNIVSLYGYASAEDVEDDDEYEEILENLIDMANEIGPSVSVTISRPSKAVGVEGPGTNQCIACVTFVDITHAVEAQKRWNRMAISGNVIEAKIGKEIAVNTNEDSTFTEDVHNAEVKERVVEPTAPVTHSANSTKEEQCTSTDQSKDPTKETPILYSGDKIIPTEYAKCKLVPKVPNIGIRKYATETAQLEDETVVPLLFEMLGELMRLQLRSKDDKNARARRRLVMGLREVARGIRAHQVKMVIMANNLDDYGALDSKLVEILDLARENELPVIFNLNKRKIGKALGKKIKVSVVGIQNADGAYPSFKKLKKMFS